MASARAHAKVNLALVAGPLREDGKHEVVTVLQRIDLHDDVALEPADELTVEGFPEDTIVRDALRALADVAKTEPAWRVRIEKRIPVAAGLGGGSTDAAAALVLANELLLRPLDLDSLHRVAAGIGADVPFFLGEGAQVGTGDGTVLEPVGLPSDYHVVLITPHAVSKESTGGVYADFDARSGAAGFERRAADLRRALAAVTRPADLAHLPRNDLASSPLAERLVSAGAFRADVTGTGPTVYGLFEQEDVARAAADGLAGEGRTFFTRPVAR
jgi:4-diphosphocytidyl-2-C-methyl-D-erythritol kinase